MSMALKICGIRRLEDVSILNQYQPDYAGFICSQPFWRYVSSEYLKSLHQNLTAYKACRSIRQSNIDEI